MRTTAAIASLEVAVAHLAVPAIVVLGHQRCGAVEAAFHPELRLTPSLSQVVGQLRMELFGLGAAEDLEEACRLDALNAARNFRITPPKVVVDLIPATPTAHLRSSMISQPIERGRVSN